MATKFLVVALVCAATSAAPPVQQRYPQHVQAQLQQINPLDYYLDHQGVDYYRSAEQKQVSVNGPARLESLEPDSEVELVPGVQQPQQPPQQNPVAPNVPGLLPGQRVFIVHMPVPGYRPGSIGGYQPVYIVAAGAQGNAGFPGNGYQNAVLLDPSGQGVVSPFQLGYPRGLVGPQVIGGLQYNRPYDVVYQDPGLVNGAGQQVQAEAGREPLRFVQAVGLQGQVNPAAYKVPGNPPQGLSRSQQNGAPAQLKQSPESGETKESIDTKSNHRAQAIARNKA